MLFDVYFMIIISYYNFFYYARTFDICYILGENLDFDNLFPPETLYLVFYPVDCSYLEDRMLNCKEHLSKIPHLQPDKNWITMFVFKFSANICPAHKHLVLCHYLYRLQEHDNKTIYILIVCHNCTIFHSFLKCKQTCQKLLLEMDAHSFDPLDGVG
ncbi:hypothetical protein M9H77_11261 [Catharanthus roseus]|uniref:Uncharacterized protein n=1 Tax=Catharanthus roseus TaxID=4058 RepID=A0ACC0BE29_CATRO|nr:hypothetical protein M9H77_11261 [Catharanthus roseus]